MDDSIIRLTDRPELKARAAAWFHAKWGVPEQSPAPTTISEIICAFKSIPAKQINVIENAPGRKCWQRSFYDHVVRNEKEYLQIWSYIDNNPLKWELDRFYESK